MTMEEQQLRWQNYVMSRGNQFSAFWKDYLNMKTKDALFILGLGFDPRMCLGYESILKMGGAGRRDCMTVVFEEGFSSSPKRYERRVKDNERRLTSLVPNGSTRILKKIRMVSELDNRRIGSSEALNIVSNSNEIADYDDIIIDISALPEVIYFPLIGKVLRLVDLTRKVNKPINLHILVCENVNIDRMIRAEGIAEDATYIRGFTGELQSETHARTPKIWIPILGENQEQQLIRISDKVKADETIPMVPMPSSDPRRVDDLILEYRKLLFDRLLIDPKNLLYGAEANPFEAYRQLCRTIYHYRSALRPIGKCQVAISASSSKLLSIAALLAAYELKELGVGIINVETLGYHVDEEIESNLSSTDINSLWIAGDCYDT